MERDVLPLMATMPMTTISLMGWRSKCHLGYGTSIRVVAAVAAAAVGASGDKKPGDKEKGQRRSDVLPQKGLGKFCADKIDDINYKDAKLLGPFVPERGKDPAAAHLGHLCDAPAQAADRDQARLVRSPLIPACRRIRSRARFWTCWRFQPAGPACPVARAMAHACSRRLARPVMVRH